MYAPPEPGVYRVRVDRASVLGNPFVMRVEGDRDVVCRAYERLLVATLDPTADVPQNSQSVWRIGRGAGHTGVIRGWDWDGARAEIGNLRRLSQAHCLRLDCHCFPRRCHGDSLAALLNLW